MAFEFGLELEVGSEGKRERMDIQERENEKE